MHIVIVDDDRWVRGGRAAALRDAGIVVTEYSHQEALEQLAWADVDLALLDAYDEEADFDRFSGVLVTEAIRKAPGGADVRIVVVTGHLLNDVLRLRLADAGADELYAHAEVRTIEALLVVVRNPIAARSAHPSPAELAQAGLGAEARPSDALRWVAAHELEGAFEPGVPQKALPTSRRRLITARRRLSSFMGIASGRGRDGVEWREVVRLVNRARGEERRRP